MARSASPPEGQALPGRFGRPGGVGGIGAGPQGHGPLLTEAVLSLRGALGPGVVRASTHPAAEAALSLSRRFGS